MASGPHPVYSGGREVSLGRPERAQPAIIPGPAHLAHVPGVVTPAGRRVWIWLWGVLALALIALVSYFASALGVAASIGALVLAVIPFAAVVMSMLWVDRWEPEPRGLVVFALAWGAIVSVVFALLIDLAFRVVVDPSPLWDLISTVIKAPIVEELIKGIGVLLIFVMGRRAFDGPVDGVVYGALIGAGFALTENVQYFAIAVIEGGPGVLGLTFVMRGLLSPFAHAMFTCVIGLAVGLAARRGARLRESWGTWAVGVAVAIALHAFWNGSAALTDLNGWIFLYVVAQVPLFVLFMIGLSILRRHEERLTATNLEDYAAAGWFTPQEVGMLATPAGRRGGLHWAKGLPGDRVPLMREFIRTTTALAATRHRAKTGRDPHAARDERTLLERAVSLRASLLA